MMLPYVASLLLFTFGIAAQSNAPDCVSTCLNDIAIDVGCVSGWVHLVGSIILDMLYSYSFSQGELAMHLHYTVVSH